MTLFHEIIAGACKRLLGDEAYVTASSFTGNDLSNVVMDWRGMSLDEPEEICHGWKPDASDEEPYLVFEFRDTVEITGLLEYDQNIWRLLFICANHKSAMSVLSVAICSNFASFELGGRSS